MTGVGITIAGLAIVKT
ncbi:hypothetical protein [Pedobacter gandavensis]